MSRCRYCSATEIAAGAKTESPLRSANLDPISRGGLLPSDARARAGGPIVAGALRIYKSLWDLARWDYGMEPSPRRKELVADISSALSKRPAGGLAPSLNLAAAR